MSVLSSQPPFLSLQFPESPALEASYCKGTQEAKNYWKRILQHQQLYLLYPNSIPGMNLQSSISFSVVSQRSIKMSVKPCKVEEVHCGDLKLSLPFSHTRPLFSLQQFASSIGPRVSLRCVIFSQFWAHFCNNFLDLAEFLLHCLSLILSSG